MTFTKLSTIGARSYYVVVFKAFETYAATLSLTEAEAIPRDPFSIELADGRVFYADTSRPAFNFYDKLTRKIDVLEPEALNDLKKAINRSLDLVPEEPKAEPADGSAEEVLEIAKALIDAVRRAC